MLIAAKSLDFSQTSGDEHVSREVGELCDCRGQEEAPSEGRNQEGD